MKLHLPVERPVASQIDMAEIKHAQWCRNEIGSAERNMAAAAATQGKARIERQVYSVLNAPSPYRTHILPYFPVGAHAPQKTINTRF